MKKWFITLLSVLLVSAMLFSFSACTEDATDLDIDIEETEEPEVPALDIVGTWSGSANYPTLAEGFELEEFYVDMTLEFAEGDTLVVTVTEEAMTQAFTDNADAIIESAIASLGGGMTIDEYLGVLGVDKTGFIEVLLSESGAELAFSEEGTYTFENDVLTIGETEVEYSYDGTTLTIDATEFAGDFTK